jgi:signal transduction histidine kinase
MVKVLKKVSGFKQGIGLSSIQERAAMIGGTADITVYPDQAQPLPLCSSKMI